jgi:hypothetical protein
MGDFGAANVEQKAMAIPVPQRPLRLPDSFRYVSCDIPAGVTLADYRRHRAPRPRPWWRRLVGSRR